jgi:hypothetical protein
MAEAQITVTINGITQAVKDFDDLQKVIRKVEEESKKAGKAAKKSGEDAKDAAKKQEDSLGPVSKRLKGLKEDFAGFTSDLKKGFAGGVNAIKGFGEALGLGTKAAKGLAVGLSALGIPLLIAAVTALVGWFKNFEGGAKALQTALNVLGAIMDGLTEAFMALVNLDFGGFIDSLTGIGGKAVEAARQTDTLFKAQKTLFEQTKKLTVENANLNKEIEGQKKILEDTTLSYDDRLAALQKVNTATQQLAKNQVALTQANLAELKAQLALEKNYEKRRELELKIAETQAALIDSQTQLNNTIYDAGKAERELRKEENERIKEAAAKRKEEKDKKIQDAKDVAAALEKLRLQTLTDELEAIKQSLAAEKDAAIEQLKAKGATAEQIAQLEEYYNQLGIQRVDAYNAKVQQQNDAAQKAEDDKKAQDDAAKLQKQRSFDDQLLALQNATATTAQEQLNNEYLASQTALDRQLQDGLITREQYQQLVTANDEVYAQKRVDIAQQELDQKKALQEQQIAAVGATFGQLAQLLGEESQAGKNAASAEALISSYLAANKAYASLAGIPIVGPALGAAAAGIAIASGLKNVQKIQTAKPKAATGGLIVGPSHSNGGVPIEAEGGEYIINRAAMQVPGVASMAQSLNSTARPQYADGGIIENTSNQLNAMGSMPIRTYVVANEVTSAQQANFQIERLSKL